MTQSLAQQIGNTPLVRVKRQSGQKADIWVKIESFNPGGSVKDRVALEMIEDAERKGIIAPGATLIEPTSGNTGVGLAWVGRLKGY
jgi:cysteine synthase A